MLGFHTIFRGFLHNCCQPHCHFQVLIEETDTEGLEIVGKYCLSTVDLNMRVLLRCGCAGTKLKGKNSRRVVTGQGPDIGRTCIASSWHIDNKNGKCCRDCSVALSNNRLSGCSLHWLEVSCYMQFNTLALASFTNFSKPQYPSQHAQ